MNQGNFSTPYGAPMGLGVQQQPMAMYNQQQTRQPEYTNPLGNKKIEELLRKGNSAKNLTISEEDYTEAICTHRFNGQIQLYDMQDEEGKHKCKICGAEFVVTDEANMKDVAKATDILMSILHTAKMAWLDMPDKTGTDFFQAIAIIKKTPELFKVAMDNFASHTNSNYNLQNMNNPVGGFNMYNQIMGPGLQPQYQQQQYYDPNAQQQQQYYNQGMQQQPQFQQQQQYNPMPNNFNPAAQAMQASAPGMTNTGFGYYTDPNAAAGTAQPNPQETAPNKGETVTKQLKTGL